MAIYPTDAVINAQLFTVTATTNFGSVTGQTYFNLPGIVGSRAEVLFELEGITQSPFEYEVANGGASGGYASISYNAPVTGDVVIKIISIPPIYSIKKVAPSVTSVFYSNSIVTTINANNYTVNGVNNTWALPQGVVASQKSEIFVYIDGVAQSNTAYNWPSPALGSAGINIDPALPYWSVLDIRVISGETVVESRLTTMADRKPDRGFQAEKEYSIVPFETQAGYEKRRLVSRRPKRSYNITYTNISGVEKDAIDSFFNNRSGSYESFTFDLDHLNEVGTLRVRFDGPIQASHNLSGLPSDKTKNFYTVNIRLKEVFD